MAVLVTGGAGFIGSHTCVELLNADYQVVVVDNLCNSSIESIRRVEKITGKSLTFYEVNLLDEQKLDAVFAKHPFSAVIHFAALKAVGESVQQPLDYYTNNLDSTLILLKLMKKHGVKNIVFSSSATVYGIPKSVPVDESFPLSCTNPYGRTKLFIEDILRDMAVAEKDWRIVLLRYFNPCGAHSSGLIGEDPRGIPNNLMPYVLQVADGRRKEVTVHGNDYDTPDGTGVRDYIHVVDLALGHVAALRRIQKMSPGAVVYNLGTGRGYSVLEMIKAMEKACGKPIPYVIGARRPGDVAAVYAETKLAAEELGWRATRGVDEMCADNWRWASQNPKGFASS